MKYLILALFLITGCADWIPNNKPCPDEYDLVAHQVWHNFWGHYDEAPLIVCKYPDDLYTPCPKGEDKVGYLSNWGYCVAGDAGRGYVKIVLQDGGLLDSALLHELLHLHWLSIGIPAPHHDIYINNEVVVDAIDSVERLFFSELKLVNNYVQETMNIE